MPANLVTLPGITLCEAGTWECSTGPATFTPADLAAAVEALDCSAVRRPVIKLGHIDDRFDGEPAVGRIANMALASSGMALVGDYAGLPAWLSGEVMASAYGSRSIEGVWNHRCALGHTHGFVVTAVALLGVNAPAVETLDDIATLYGLDVAAAIDPNGTGTPVRVTFATQEAPMLKEATDTIVNAAGFANRTKCTTCSHLASMHNDRADTGDNSGACAANGCDCSKMVGTAKASTDPAPTPPTQVEPVKVAAQASVEDVRRAYYDSAAGGGWNWIREIYVDPPQLIVDNGDDDLFRVAYSIDSAGNVAFDDPIEVAVTYVDQVAAKAAKAARTFASKADSRPQPAPVKSSSRQEGSPMDLTKLRASLGLADDASEEDVSAALADRLTKAEAAEARVAELEQAKPPSVIPPSVIPPGATLIEESVLEGLKTAAAKGVEARDRQRQDDRERYLDGAVRAGKVLPARRSFWSDYYDKDEAGAREYFDKVAAGSAIPLTEVGHAGTGDNNPSDIDAEFAEFARLGLNVGMPSKGA